MLSKGITNLSWYKSNPLDIKKSPLCLASSLRAYREPIVRFTDRIQSTNKVNSYIPVSREYISSWSRNIGSICSGCNKALFRRCVLRLLYSPKSYVH